MQVLINGYVKDDIELKKFTSFCKWFSQANHVIKISNDIYHDMFQDKELLDGLTKKYPNLIWKRREDASEFIKMGRWRKHPTSFAKPPNCTLRSETIIIQQDGKINFCCGGYSAAIGTFKETFNDIIKRRHEFISYLKTCEGTITHDTCKKCRKLFSQYFKSPLDTRWG